MNEEEAIKNLKEILKEKELIDKIEDDIEREIEYSAYIEEMPFKAIDTVLKALEQKDKEISELKEEINYWKECAEGEAGLRKQIQEDYQEQMQELLESEGI